MFGPKMMQVDWRWWALQSFVFFGAALDNLKMNLIEAQAKEMHKGEHVYIPSKYQDLGKYDR